MGDDVVEPAQSGQVHARDVASDQLEVVEAQGFYAGSPDVDLDLREVDAHDVRLGVCDGERNDVTPSGTTDFEHTCAGHLGSFQPEQVRDRGQVARR